MVLNLLFSLGYALVLLRLVFPLIFTRGFILDFISGFLWSYQTKSRFSYEKVALSLETYGLTVEAQQLYLDLIGKEQRGSGPPHVSQDELETWEVKYKKYKNKNKKKRLA